MRKIDSVLDVTLKKIEPEKKELEFMNRSSAEFLKQLKVALVSLKIEAEPFVGGSFAKNTVVKKNLYDCDIFLRFKKTDKDISKITKRILEKAKIKAEIIHGSRDYFNILVTKYFCIELIPVKKISSPKVAENITDLSYSHVKYLNKKVKSKKIINDIKLMKAFCHAKECYGAESYINGFSGYSLELLIYHFKGFEKFLRAMVKNKGEKIIIDLEKQYKNKREILLNLNESKLGSPIVLIDPTFKERNVTAALSEETFKRFIEVAGKFLKNPLEEDFERDIEDIDYMKNLAEKNNQEFLEMLISTKKQAGDIAGTKLKKFYKHLVEEVEKRYKIKKSGFIYDNVQSAKIYFIINGKKELCFMGPFKDDIKNVKAFKKEHKNVRIKNNRYYIKEKTTLIFKEFMNKWKVKNDKKIKEMAISKFMA